MLGRKQHGIRVKIQILVPPFVSSDTGQSHHFSGPQLFIYQLGLILG